MTNLSVNGCEVTLTRKKIKHLHLRVHPPYGYVTVSAPKAMSVDKIHSFVLSKLKWIKKHQQKCLAQGREVPLEYVDGENHYFNGESFVLQVNERDAPPQVSLSDRQLLLQVRPDADKNKRQVVLDTWYRQQLEEKLEALISHWQTVMGVLVERTSIRKMKTRWGSCTPGSRSIRINLELIKKPPHCLEYVVVHELTHLIEPSHNAHFYALMDRFLPNWRLSRKALNAPHTHLKS